jgi:hypothetical protein
MVRSSLFVSLLICILMGGRDYSGFAFRIGGAKNAFSLLNLNSVFFQQVKSSEKMGEDMDMLRTLNMSMTTMTSATPRSLP